MIFVFYFIFYLSCVFHKIYCSQDFCRDPQLTGSQVPAGHLLPFGEHRASSGSAQEIDASLVDALSAEEFFDLFMKRGEKSPEPLIIRRLALGTAAFEQWSDEYLIDSYGDETFTTENTLYENHDIPTTNENIREFLKDKQYFKRNSYVVSEYWPQGMSSEVPLPSFLACADYQFYAKVF